MSSNDGTAYGDDPETVRPRWATDREEAVHTLLTACRELHRLYLTVAPHARPEHVPLWAADVVARAEAAIAAAERDSRNVA